MPRLSRTDYVVIADWLRKEETKTTLVGAGYNKLAEIANQDLDLTSEVSRTSIGNLVRDFNLQETYTKAIKPDRLADLQDQLTDLQDRVDHLENFLKRVGNLNGLMLVDRNGCF